MTINTPDKTSITVLTLEWVEGIPGSEDDITQQRPKRLFFSNADSAFLLNGFVDGSGAPLAVAPDPLLEAELAANDGGFDNQQSTIRMSADFGFARAMLGGRAFATVSARVYVLTFDPNAPLPNVDVTRYVVADGTVVQGAINPQGDQGLVELLVEDCRRRLADAPLGLRASTTCRWIFGDAKTCGADVLALREFGTMNIPDLDSNEVVVSGLTTRIPNYWRKGSVYWGGVEVRISDFDPGTNTFTLTQMPPVAWLDQLALSGPFSVAVTPGCDKTVSDCRVFGREARFMAPGVAIPARNPLFQSSAGS